MSVAASPATGRPYGVERVCAAWDFPRSSFYLGLQRQTTITPAPSPAKRGPKTPLTDTDLLALIRQDLAQSPWLGEGHRKVWARLRFGLDIRVSRKRVLRIMRENNLLSPHRWVRPPCLHDGEITTARPNVMWGADGTQVLTVEDGKVWVFAAVEHWSAECVGHYVCKEGSRFNALQPVAEGLLKHFGSVAKDTGRGLALRHDHGSAYTSDHFQNQLKFWGIAPSFAFVGEPQTNGVAERFFRTLKEQIVYGRIYRNLEELRLAVERFVDGYNEQWLVEKNGFLSPNEMRRNFLQKEAA